MLQSKLLAFVTNKLFDSHGCNDVSNAADATWRRVLPLIVLNGSRYDQILAEVCIVFDGLLDLEMVSRQPLSAVVVELLFRPAAQSVLDIEKYML